MPKILIADDEPGMLLVLVETFQARQYEVVTANNAESALQLVKEQAPDVVLADIEMPEGKPTGLELLRHIKEFRPALPVLLITGEGSLEYAVTALRERAYDFIRKPFRIDEVVRRVENALTQQQGLHALQENAVLKTQLREKFRFENIIGNSPRMEAVYRLIDRVANTDSTVLLLGESGTGKELVARALHYNSRRAAQPFVAVNCAALPEHLMESELFGHRKGAFTGAAMDKIGLLEHANGGTVFLDEIGSMALGLQSKLLRFLQDREIRRVGDTSMIKVDVRVLAATNEPLQLRLQEKAFREDLYYRISVIPIALPPLRDRVEDIPLLVAHFVDSVARRLGRARPAVPEEVLEVLQAYAWPGNVRELQNAVERASALCDDGVIALRDLPERILESLNQPQSSATVAASPVAGPDLALDGALPLKDFVHQQEVRYIEYAINAAGGSKEKAAQKLDISIATLYRKLAVETEPAVNHS